MTMHLKHFFTTTDYHTEINSEVYSDETSVNSEIFSCKKNVRNAPCEEDSDSGCEFLDQTGGSDSGREGGLEELSDWDLCEDGDPPAADVSKEEVENSLNERAEEEDSKDKSCTSSQDQTKEENDENLVDLIEESVLEIQGIWTTLKNIVDTTVDTLSSWIVVE